MAIFKNILEIALFSILALGIFTVLKIYVFDKIKINKWIILALAMIEFLIPNLLWTTMPVFVGKYIIPGIFVILFLWFMDLCGFMKKIEGVSTPKDKYYQQYNKSNNKVIKPKAKPNRVKKK